jgi:hypothetical protein
LPIIVDVIDMRFRLPSRPLEGDSAIVGETIRPIFYIRSPDVETSSLELQRRVARLIVAPAVDVSHVQEIHGSRRSLELALS